MQRILAIWFPHLLAEGMIRRRPHLKALPFVLAAPDRGRMRVTAASIPALSKGIYPGMAVADGRALVAGLTVMNAEPGQSQQLLTALGYWCIRYTPTVAVDGSDGLLLNISGCAHLWGGEVPYASTIQNRLKAFGYTTRFAIAGTVGAAWALARYAKQPVVLAPSGEERAALCSLPPAALRLEPATIERLQKLGLTTIGHFMDRGRSILRRRFGVGLLDRLDEALGWKAEPLQPLQPVEPFQLRLPCLEPIVTRSGIEIALEQLLDMLCQRLAKEGKGLRKAVLNAYRVDGEVQSIEIGTHLASCQLRHLFKLFELKIDRIEPALGIELFILEATQVEKARFSQEALWHPTSLQDARLAELLDQLAGKLGQGVVRRYLPAEHYWPERSFTTAKDLAEQPATHWQKDRPRPVRLLRHPEPVEVAAPIPDYPPMHFRHKGQLHTIKKADGPERIEAEWWIQEGEHRDYYVVEDETGARFWLFRLGHYSGDQAHQWYLHGFFA
ncbi:DNA polymerase Y family protein [Flavihumibacter sp. CACIAM 22H1]|uniref:Y-family DNA polymerase n=1 Tax=Flavihumibacter sp. CACIAM 22H1 TaxID=1812911 RepID=UPI0007A8C414|nr:DNA polymerase Y family protein [Flavihumibacter sp. CACIAM 22H1]KYP14040.1 MAG: nucleotidyltransferase [Flavihumibacter sp. CACIAM 22H1]